MWELSVLEWFDSIHGTFLDDVMVAVTNSAAHGLVWLIMGAIMMLSRRWRRCGSSMVLAILLVFLIVDLVMKPLFCRERPYSAEDFQLLVPPPEDWSFPSGHTSSAFAGATVLLIHSRRWGCIAMAYAALVGFTRIYLCVHWPTDVLAGAFCGIAIAFLAVLIVSRLPYLRDLDKGEAII